MAPQSIRSFELFPAFIAFDTYHLEMRADHMNVRVIAPLDVLVSTVWTCVRSALKFPYDDFGEVLLKTFGMSSVLGCSLRDG